MTNTNDFVVDDNDNAADDHLPVVQSTKEIFKGRVFRVTRDEVEERAGDVFVRETIEHAGSGCVLPLFDDGTVALVRQYRHPARAYLLEIPAGSRERDEAPEVCARRELEEEIGFACERLELLAEFYPSPGFLAEKMWVYVASGLRPTAQRLETDEIVEVVRVSISEAMRLIETGGIIDAKTIIALLMLAPREARTSNNEAGMLRRKVDDRQVD